MKLDGATIPDRVVARAVARHGCEHPYADLDPRRTALVVIDLQNGFMDPAAGFAAVPAAVAVVPKVNRLAAALRAAGGGVFWVLNTHDATCMTEWSVVQRLSLPEKRDARIAAMTEGSRGHALWPGLDARPEDAVVRKLRFSAFLPGSSDLPERLRARGFDTVLITGTVTSVCCDSSARDAMMTNFRTIMVSDANADWTQEDHDASLAAFYNIFGDVMDTAMLLDLIGRAAGGAAAGGADPAPGRAA